MNNYYLNEYLFEKRKKILNEIKPICDAYGITDYDYEIIEQREFLRVYDTRIRCSGNSSYAVIQELTGFIFLTMWKQRDLGHFSTQVKNCIKEYWMKEDIK